MSTLGKTIKLKGISQKGKNRVRENGDEWFVHAETDHVLFAKNEPGPWLYITPIGKPYDHKAGRWVHGSADTDFEVTVKE